MKFSNSSAEGLAESAERSSESQNLISASDTAHEASPRVSPGKRIRLEVPACSTDKAETLRKQWAQKLIEIQAKDPSPGSGSFSWEKLGELVQVLGLTHPNFTEDEDRERKELLKMMEKRIGDPQAGALGWADLSSLRLICLIPDWPDRSLREDLENEACLVDLEASSRKSRPFPATAVRRLKRVFERFDPHYQQNGMYHEVRSALEKTDVTSRWVLKADVVRRCLKQLFPSSEDVNRGKAWNSAKKSSAPNPEMRPAKVGTPTSKKQIVASTLQPAVAPAIAPRPASSPTQERRSAPTTASLAPRVTRISQMNIEYTDGLLKAFINLHCSILPIFDLPDLKLLYRVVRTRGDDAPESKVAIVNLCCALASVADDQRNTRQAIKFYVDGSSLLPSVKSSGDTVLLIQGHILQAQYLFETGDLDEASVAISAAISRAHSEGIHTKAGAYHPIPENDLQLRAKIWHAIQVFERTLALYRGVAPPNFCSDCNAAFPRAGTFSEDDQDVTQTQRVGFVAFNAWARLYQFVDTMMGIEREFRIYEPGCQMHKIACNFKDYNEEHARLSGWKRTLSERLKHVPNDRGDVSRLRTIIHLRYLYYRLRLHRPLLILAVSLSLNCTECPGNEAHLSDPSLEAPIEFAVIRDGFIKCFNAAIELCGQLSHYTGNSSPVHYFRNACLAEHAEFAYACGLVFLAARIVPGLSMSPGSGITSANTIHSASSCALGLLRRYGKADCVNKKLSTRISRCADALEALSKAVGADGPFGFISEGVGFPTESWQKLYGRLKVDLPLRETVPAVADSSMSFAWIESETVDFDG